MCDQTEVKYKEGDIVWVKLGSFFWPGEVKDVEKLDEEIVTSFKKPPIAAVKFFEEDKYEYVKNLNQICLYNCRKKHEYIKKGLDMYRKQKEGSYMDKFPEDVRRAELQTHGNPDILSDPQFVPQEKVNYQALFGGDKKAKLGSSKLTSPAPTNGRRSKSLSTPPLRTPPPFVKITHPRFLKDESEHKVHIRHQPVSSPPKKESPAASPIEAAYRCQLCDFTSNRLNVIVLHNKYHSGATPTNNVKGRGSTAKSKSSGVKVRATTVNSEPKSKAKAKNLSNNTEVQSKIPSLASSPVKVSTSPQKASGVKRKIFEDEKMSTDKKSKTTDVSKVSTSVEETLEKQQKPSKTPEKSPEVIKSPVSGKRKGSKGEDKVMKKAKNDEEIRDKLLADWDDEDAEQEEKEMEILKQKLLKSEGENASDSNDETQGITGEGKGSTAGSCFDFDDSKDAILDNELEERAKKFVENRKIPRVVDEKAEKLESAGHDSPDLQDSSPFKPETDPIPSASTEEFDKAINSLLADTAVPKLPQIPIGISEPCKSSTLLPDLVLDSNLATENENKVVLVGLSAPADVRGGDHDYSSKQRDKETVIPSIIEEDFLDINSMPVVMADAIVTEVPALSQAQPDDSQMPKIDLIPNPNASNTHTFAMSDVRIAMPPSVQSVVKAVRGSTTDRSKVLPKTVSVPQIGSSPNVSNKTTFISSRQPSSEKLTPARGTRFLPQGIASGKYVIVQPAGSSQPRLTPISSMPQKVSVKPLASSPQPQMGIQTSGSGKVVIITKPNSGGQQQVLTPLTPAQQKALVAGGKLPPPQRLLTSTGQLLTPVNPRSVMAKGTKLTPIPGQQVRNVASGKLGPKLQMQSLQTKIILPTMETVKIPITQPQPTVRMVNVGKSQSNTILIQATQSSSVLSSIVSKVSTSTSQLSPRLTMQPKQQKSRLLTSTTMLQQAAGKPAQILPSSAKVQQIRPAFQPRMILQKPRTSLLANLKTETQSVNQAPRILPRSQVTNPTSQIQVTKQFVTVGRSVPQPVKKVTNAKAPLLASKAKMATSRQPVQKTTLVTTPSIPSTTGTVELITTQTLPPLAPLHLSSTTSNDIVTLSQSVGMPLPSFQTNITEQLVPTSAPPIGDPTTPTYVLLTIDEAGNLQPYNSQSLISYDGNDQAGQTLYIDSSSLESGGDLDNLILTIDNTSSLALDMGQTSTMTSVSSIYNQRPPSSSQDILAAALANTDVFQSEVSLQDTLTVVNSNRSTVMSPCVVQSSVMLSSPPSSLLLPSLNRPADVSETSLTLNQPIMTPLEVPSAVVPVHNSGRMSYPMELPLTVTQSMSIPVSSYTVVGENLPTSDPIFQPSMPLLSEEVSEPPSTTSSDLSHTQLPFHAIEDTEQLIYQSHLPDETSGNTQSPQETVSVFNTPHSEEISMTSSVKADKCESTIPTEISERAGNFTSSVSSENSGKSNFYSATSSFHESNLYKPETMHVPADINKVSDTLPSSLLSTHPQENDDVILSVQTTKQPDSLDQAILPIGIVEESRTKISSFQLLQNESETCISTQSPSGQFLEETTLETTLEIDSAENIVPSQDIPTTDNNQSQPSEILSEEIVEIGGNSTFLQPDPDVGVSPNETAHDTHDVASSKVTLISTEMGSDILGNLLEMPANPSKTETLKEVVSSPQSMPLLSDDSAFINPPANVEEVFEDKGVLEQLSKDSKSFTDTAANGIGFEAHDR